ncbi:MAG: transporter substrate-binding domain-containing protein [Rhodospirillales bacterium]|nr:transporter substrate-binding domain-containing protein [Rhodospirillales bacterium]
MAPQNLAIRRIALGVLGLGAAVLASPDSATAAEKLKLGNEGTYPPFSMVDSSGKLTGVEPDLAREVCKRMNVECEFVVMDFKALIPSLLQNKFDALTTQLSPTAERKEKINFTTPIVYNPMTFVVPASSNYEFSKAGMTGKGVKLGLQRGSSGVKYIQDRYGDAMEYVFYDNPDQVRLDLLAGRINATFDSKINWTVELINKPEGKDWKLAGGDHWTGDPATPEAERGYGWGVRKGDDALLKRLNETLNAVIADCTYTKIRKVYLNITTLPGDAACNDKVN